MQPAQTPPANDARVSELEETLHCLMSRFAATPSVWLADAVVSHLDQLLRYPASPRLSRRRRHTYDQLMPTWQTIARRLGAFAPVGAAQ